MEASLIHGDYILRFLLLFIYLFMFATISWPGHASCCSCAFIVNSFTHFLLTVMVSIAHKDVIYAYPALINVYHI